MCKMELAHKKISGVKGNFTFIECFDRDFSFLHRAIPIRFIHMQMLLTALNYISLEFPSIHWIMGKLIQKLSFIIKKTTDDNFIYNLIIPNITYFEIVYVFMAAYQQN